MCLCLYRSSVIDMFITAAGALFVYKLYKPTPLSTTWTGGGMALLCSGWWLAACAKSVPQLSSAQLSLLTVGRETEI